MSETKVFCVGFQKTGTSSLGLALAQLGSRVTGYHPFRHLAAQPDLDMETVWEVARPVAEAHDAAKDTPWPVLYRQLDEAFPNAKFVHIVRDPDSWIRSVVKDFGNHHNEIHRLIYGSDCPVGYESEWLTRYDRHNREVLEYFSGRSDDFVSLDMTKGEVNWANLCDFLGCPMPDTPWPHANTWRAKRRNLFWWRQQSRLRGYFGL